MTLLPSVPEENASAAPAPKWALVLNGVFYVVTLVALMLMVITCLFVAPKFEGIFRNFRLELPAATIIVLSVRWGLALLAVTLIVAILLKEYYVSSVGPRLVVNLVAGLLSVLALVLVILSLFTPYRAFLPPQ